MRLRHFATEMLVVTREQVWLSVSTGRRGGRYSSQKLQRPMSEPSGVALLEWFDGGSF
jgi:hypothetical protein